MGDVCPVRLLRHPVSVNERACHHPCQRRRRRRHHQRSPVAMPPLPPRPPKKRYLLENRPAELPASPQRLQDNCPRDVEEPAPSIPPTMAHMLPPAEDSANLQFQASNYYVAPPVSTNGLNGNHYRHLAAQKPDDDEQPLNLSTSNHTDGADSRNNNGNSSNNQVATVGSNQQGAGGGGSQEVHLSNIVDRVVEKMLWKRPSDSERAGDPLRAWFSDQFETRQRSDGSSSSSADSPVAGGGGGAVRPRSVSPAPAAESEQTLDGERAMMEVTIGMSDTINKVIDSVYRNDSGTAPAVRAGDSVLVSTHGDTPTSGAVSENQQVSRRAAGPAVAPAAGRECVIGLQSLLVGEPPRTCAAGVSASVRPVVSRGDVDAETTTPGVLKTPLPGAVVTPRAALPGAVVTPRAALGGRRPGPGGRPHALPHSQESQPGHTAPIRASSATSPVVSRLVASAPISAVAPGGAAITVAAPVSTPGGSCDDVPTAVAIGTLPGHAGRPDRVSVPTVTVTTVRALPSPAAAVAPPASAAPAAPPASGNLRVSTSTKSEQTSHVSAAREESGSPRLAATAAEVQQSAPSVPPPSEAQVAPPAAAAPPLGVPRVLVSATAVSVAGTSTAGTQRTAGSQSGPTRTTVASGQLRAPAPVAQAGSPSRRGRKRALAAVSAHGDGSPSKHTSGGRGVGSPRAEPSD